MSKRQWIAPKRHAKPKPPPRRRLSSGEQFAVNHMSQRERIAWRRAGYPEIKETTNAA